MRMKKPLKTHSTERQKKAILVQILLFFPHYVFALNMRTLFQEEIKQTCFRGYSLLGMIIEGKPLLKIYMKIWVTKTNLKCNLFMFRRHVCELNTKANIILNTEVAGYNCGDKKRKQLYHPAQTSGWVKFVCRVQRSGNEKNKSILFFSFYLNLLFRKIKNLIVCLTLILVRPGENSKWKAISFSFSRFQNVKKEREGVCSLT